MEIPYDVAQSAFVLLQPARKQRLLIVRPYTFVYAVTTRETQQIGTKQPNTTQLKESTDPAQKAYPCQKKRKNKLTVLPHSQTGIANRCTWPKQNSARCHCMEQAWVPPSLARFKPTLKNNGGSYHCLPHIAEGWSCKLAQPVF